jgi:threonine aldolase
LATRLAQIPGVNVDPLSVETNIVIIDVSEATLSALEISEKLLAAGVRIGAMDANSMRAVTHLDVDQAGVIRAGDAFAKICG